MSLNEAQYNNIPKSSKVFISYSHDSPQHKRCVLQLSNRLRSEGVDCNIDQYEASPSEGWFRWMVNQVEEADYVLIVCTENYEKRFKGKEEVGKGLGAKWEGAIITQELYYSEVNNKCIPIVFSPEDSEYVPSILKSATYYNLSTEEVYNELYARLTDQKLVLKSDIGELRPLPRNFSQSIRMQNKEIELAESNKKPAIGELRKVSGGFQNSETPKIFTSSQSGARIKDRNNLPRAVIFTAIPVEYSAVRDHLEDLEEKEHPCRTIYEQGIFSSGDREWNVGIVETGQGNEQAALEVERAIQYFSPSIALFVGVAGGVKDVQLGDVVVANKVYGYESGKAGDNFYPRPEAFTPDYKLVNRAKAEARKDDWLQRLGVLVPNLHPNVFVKPTAAGAKVLSSTLSEAYNLIKSNYGDTLAVEMEGDGFLRAAHANSHVSALVIRGISDLIDKKEEADKVGYQEIASRHASAFAFEVLAKSYIEPVDSTQKSAEISDNPKVFTSSSTGMQFVLIPAGKFIMGSIESEFEMPIHEVKISKPFFLGKCLVTQRQWKAIMGNNPSYFEGGNDRPVESVTWNDVQEFIKKLNKVENTNKYRLPSEAEWEYGCRAGTQTRYSFGDAASKLDLYGWYRGNSGNRTHKVGKKKPNPWGLYDMHGNVWEWVQDNWHENYIGAPSNEKVWESKGITYRTRRGGCWNSFNRCRSASRYGDAPDVHYHLVGFRVLREL